MIKITVAKHLEKRDFLLDLFQKSYDRGISLKFWDWKYVKNPSASSDPEIIIAIDNGTIVGATPFFLSELWVKNRKIIAASPTDLMVDPQYRRRGIFYKMTQFALNDLRRKGIAFIFNFPNDMARSGYLKQNWKIMSNVETLYRFFNARKIVTTFQNQFLGIFSGLLDKYFNPRNKMNLSSENFQIRVFNTFTDELLEIDNLRDQFKIELVRNKAYLKWRFDQHPEQNYKYTILKRGDELCGYAVINKVKLSNNLVLGRIVDFLIKDNHHIMFQTLVNKCLNELKQLKCDLVNIWSFSNPEFRKYLIRDFSFKSSLKYPYNRYTTKSYIVTKELNKQIVKQVDIHNNENWSVTQAFSDMT